MSLNDGVVMGMPEYPKRPKFFSHRFCRLMAKVCLANEIGPEACWMLTVIVQTEDASHYRRPVTFRNEQLAALCGMSDKQFRGARDRAIKAGWLCHVKGTRLRAPAYWVTVPPHADGLDDLPSDEGHDADESAQPLSLEPLGGHPSGSNGAVIGQSSGSNRAVIGQSKGAPSSLSSSLSSSLTQDDDRTAGGPGEEPFDPLLAADEAKRLFVSRWNAAGLPKLGRLTPTLAGLLQSALADADWARDYPAALERAGKSAFLARGENRRQGVLDPYEFLKDLDFARRVLAGRYDQHTPPQTGPPAKAGVDLAAIERRAREAIERDEARRSGNPHG